MTIFQDDTVRLIWAWHPSDPITVPALSFHWHGALTRGTRSTLLRSTRPNSVKFPDDFYRGVENVQQWDVAMSRVHIVQKTTAYMCRVFKFPRRERKYHLTGVGWSETPWTLKPGICIGFLWIPWIIWHSFGLWWNARISNSCIISASTLATCRNTMAARDELLKNIWEHPKESVPLQKCRLNGELIV